MTTNTLQLKAEAAVPGGAIQLTDTLSHRGQEPVARFYAWIGEHYSELEMRVGDVAQAGDIGFELLSITQQTSVTYAMVELNPRKNSAAFGEAFDLGLGDRVTLPTGQTLHMTAVGRYGLQLLFNDSDGCENYTHFDYGFWRDDGLFFEVKSQDRQLGTARLQVHEERAVNRKLGVGFGAEITLGPRDVACFPDGTTLRLRRAERQCYDAVDWNLLAENGDDISYIYAGSTNLAGEPTGDSESKFTLLGRAYILEVQRMDVSGRPSLTLKVDCQSLRTFPLGVRFQLRAMEYLEGPDGLRLAYRGSAHGHGLEMDPGGELVPMTSAWADFNAVKDGANDGFTVDLMHFAEPVTKSVFGYRITVSDVGDTVAVVLVESAPVDDAENWEIDEL